MRQVRCVANALDNPLGIAPAEVRVVLMQSAARMQDERFPWRWYATGPTAGHHDFITVAYVCGEDALVAFAAYPATDASVREYHRCRKEGALCIPAASTETH